MQKKILKYLIKIIKYSLWLILVVLSLVLLVPRTYHVPQMNERAGTLYWELPTGSRIAYTLISATGIKKPYPIIFLQGGPGGPIYDRNIKMLYPLSKEGYDVYLYDQIGSGFSDRLKNINDYTAYRHKRDLEEIIKKIGADKVILIGQSWGAILATLFIADNPQLVEKAIFTGPGPIQPQNNQLSHVIPPDSFHLKNPVFTNAEANRKAYNFRTIFARFLAIKFGIKLCSDKEADNFETYLTNETNKSTVCDISKAPKAEGGNGFYSHIMTVESLRKIKDPRPKLKDCKIPVLIMKGQCDNQKWGFTSEYLELFQNHKLVIIQNAGHSIYLEQPELYIKTIQDFLSK